MDTRFRDHPVVRRLESSVDLIHSKNAQKIIRYGYIHLGRVITEDVHSESDGCTAYFYQDRVKIFPVAWKNPEEIVYVLLHEFGHVVQERKRSRVLAEKMYPTLCLYDCQKLSDRPWLRKSQKYWIEYLGYELEAWNEGIVLAKTLGIKLDIEKYTKCKHKYLRYSASNFMNCRR